MLETKGQTHLVLLTQHCRSELRIEPYGFTTQFDPTVAATYVLTPILARS